jgi:GGDEF domain-containing protein
LTFQRTLTLAAPGVPLLLPLAAPLAGVPDAALAQAAHGYPYAVLATVALLGWRFQRSRVVAAAAALALAHALLWPGGGEGDPMAAGLAVALLAPLLAGLALAADRRLGAPRGFLQLAAVPAVAAVAALALLRYPVRLEGWLAAEFVPSALTGWTALPQGALAGAGLGLAVLAGAALRRTRALEAGLFWAALAGTLAAAAPAGSTARGVWVLAAALALGVALMEAAYALAFRDELTDLPGRRALRSLLRSLRPPYCIAVVDVDRFKGVNDRHGHDVGDQVLRMVAAKLGAVGGGGRAFRSGGEEFTIVFPGTPAEDALPHLEAVRRAVADAPFVLRGRRRPPGAKGAARRGRAGGDGRRLRVTVSIGVARSGPRGGDVDEVVKSADKAMYRAKQKGRNRVVA